MWFYDVFLNLLGFFIFLFIFWKKLKEDYLPNQIFAVSFYIIFFGFVLLLVVRFLSLDFWFWAVFISMIFGVILGKWRFSFRFYEAYEAALISLLPWLSFLFLLDAMKTTSWYSFCGFLFVWFLVLLYLFLNLNYKSFSWYKSGKVGFSGLVTSLFLFLSRIIVAISLPSMLSLSGNLEIVFSGLFSFVFFCAIIFFIKMKKNKNKPKFKSGVVRFPSNLLEPVANFLRKKLSILEKTKKNIEEEDPFLDPDRTIDNASPDTDAAEQFGHARVSAIKKEIDRKIIQTRKALTRIRIGKYGICESCGEMIDTDRLTVYPEATLCVKCQKKKEK